MSDEFEDIEDIKNMFSQILGSEVKIKDNIDYTEREIFITLISKLEEAIKAEKSIEKDQTTNSLWYVVEVSLKFMYGEKAFDMIQWYLFDRFEKDGSITPIEDENEKIYIFNNPEDLYSYLKYNFFENFEE